VVCLAAGLQGWLRTRTTLVDRALLLAAGGLFVTPWIAADVAALIVLGLVLGLQTLRRVPPVAHARVASLD
jgi:TRAP-type uncharacterized transport system fused permease subunit